MRHNRRKTFCRSHRTRKKRRLPFFIASLERQKRRKCNFFLHLFEGKQKSLCCCRWRIKSPFTSLAWKICREQLPKKSSWQRIVAASFQPDKKFSRWRIAYAHTCACVSRSCFVESGHESNLPSFPSLYPPLLVAPRRDRLSFVLMYVHSRNVQGLPKIFFRLETSDINRRLRHWPISR